MTPPILATAAVLRTIPIQGVAGIINKVFVKVSKENLLSKPSGISYAIPIDYARRLLLRSGLIP